MKLGNCFGIGSWLQEMKKAGKELCNEFSFSSSSILSMDFFNDTKWTRNWNCSHSFDFWSAIAIYEVRLIASDSSSFLTEARLIDHRASDLFSFHELNLVESAFAHLQYQPDCMHLAIHGCVTKIKFFFSFIFLDAHLSNDIEHLDCENKWEKQMRLKNKCN